MPRLASMMPWLLAASLLPAVACARPLGLVDVYALAVDEDPRINIAELQVEVGDARKDAARGALLPQGNFTGQFSENYLEFQEAADRYQDYPGERMMVQVRQMIFNWSAISARNRAARELDQRESELANALAEVSLDVGQRYFDVLLADDDVALLGDELELVQQQAREAEARYERKLVPVTDYLETRSRVDQVRADLIDAENRAALAREELTVITGRPVTELAPVREDFKLPGLEYTLEYWEDVAIAENPALAARRDAVAAARRGVEEARGANLPSASLVASAQRSDLGFDNLQSPERDIYYIGIDVNVPLFAGGASVARLREAWHSYYIAREEEEGARRETRKAVRSAWLSARASERRLAAAEQTVDSATTAYEAMRKAAKLGSATSADVLEVLARRTRAERDFREALYTYLASWLTLQREGGSLSIEDLDRIDRDVVAQSP